ncbi:MAG: DUF4293 domain-containing protein [Omnitrophica WOR_2 bacterium]
MIQRIQSVYLAIAAIALLVLYFFPVASFFSEFSYCKLYITHLVSLTPGVDPVISNTLIMPLGVFNGITAIIAFVSIFIYKKRLLQAKMVKLCILMTVVLISLIFFVYSPLVSRSLRTEANFVDGYGLYFILIAFLMFVLANRGIMKDERLVRSADRLR